MGQIFDAVAYDIESMTCFRTDVDKFPANCYNKSGAVKCIHYLLRQKAYRVMWGSQDFLTYSLKKSPLDFSEKFLYGFSVLAAPLDEEHITYLKEGVEDEMTLSKIDFIVEKSKLWTRLNIWDESDLEHRIRSTHSLSCDRYSHIYRGYLLNHSKRLLIDLKDYFESSEFICECDSFIRVAIDPIPILTQSGSGLGVEYGVSAETTRKLAGTWCGDVLEIKNEIPDGYKLIKCCFVDIWERARFLYRKFGLDSENFIVSDEEGTRYEAHPFRSPMFDKITIKVDDSEEEGYVIQKRANINREKNSIDYGEGYFNCKTDSIKITNLTKLYYLPFD